MSRHRNVRQMKYDEEYDDYYSNSYGKSFDDEISVSPETAQQYLYNGPDNNNSVFDFDKSSDNVDAPVRVEETCSTIQTEFTDPTDPIEKAKLLSCISEMQNVVGETIPDIDLKIAATKYNYNYELALNSVLSGEQIILTDKPKNKNRFQNKNTDDKKQNNKNQQQKKDIKDSLNSLSSFIKSNSMKLDSMKSTTSNQPKSNFSFKLPSASNLLKKESIEEEKDDFEAMFLSDISLSSKKKVATNSVITDFKKRDPFSVVKKQSTSIKSSDLIKPFNFIDNNSNNLTSLSKFIDSLKEIPLLDMDPNLRKLINEKYLKLKKKSVDRQTDTFFIFDMFYTKNAYNSRYTFDIKTYFRQYIKSFYINWLNDCPQDVITCLEFGLLGKKAQQPKLDKVDENSDKTPKIRNDVKQIQSSNQITKLSADVPKVEQMSSPKMKHKKFDPKLNVKEFEETRGKAKETINLVVIGHVDAGKSTLMGHLLVKMGYVSSKKMHSYEFNSKKIGKSSFMYAWVLDQTDEERNRGVTIDVAQANFETETKNVTLLDAPGHKDFIPNMITGASQADAAILVVDATNKEFEAGFNQGGQTKEHTMLIKSLGISQLAVAVNKLDNVNWSEERFKEIELQLKPFLKQVGFKINSVPFVPCSGLSGENLSEKSKLQELTSWYIGPCLLDVIDLFKPSERSLDKYLRFYVNNVFRQPGQSGVFVSGKVESGAIRINQKLTICPNNETCIVKNLQLDDKIVQTAFAGDHVEICLSNVDEIALITGSVLCESDALIPVASRVQARIVTFNTLSIPITNGFQAVFHYKSLTENASVLKLIASLDKSSGEVIRKYPRCLTKNTSGIVDIQLSKPICLERYQDYKELGRFMLRSKGVTIAAGIIEKIIEEKTKP